MHTVQQTALVACQHLKLWRICSTRSCTLPHLQSYPLLGMRTGCRRALPGPPAAALHRLGPPGAAGLYHTPRPAGMVIPRQSRHTAPRHYASRPGHVTAAVYCYHRPAREGSVNVLPLFKVSGLAVTSRLAVVKCGCLPGIGGNYCVLSAAFEMLWCTLVPVSSCQLAPNTPHHPKRSRQCAPATHHQLLFRHTAWMHQ